MEDIKNILSNKLANNEESLVNNILDFLKPNKYNIEVIDGWRRGPETHWEEFSRERLLKLEEEPIGIEESYTFIDLSRNICDNCKSIDTYFNIIPDSCGEDGCILDENNKGEFVCNKCIVKYKDCNCGREKIWTPKYEKKCRECKFELNICGVGYNYYCGDIEDIHMSYCQTCYEEDDNLCSKCSIYCSICNQETCGDDSCVKNCSICKKEKICKDCNKEICEGCKEKKKIKKRYEKYSIYKNYNNNYKKIKEYIDNINNKIFLMNGLKIFERNGYKLSTIISIHTDFEIIKEEYIIGKCYLLYIQDKN